MYTQNPTANRKGISFIAILLLLSIAFIIGRPFVLPKDEASGEQLKLPFKGMDEKTLPEPEAIPYPYNRRFDEERLGTCIIYAFIAPRSGYYLIPGCYGKPSHWEYVNQGQILKVGRHWNQAIPSCSSTDNLVQTVLKRRYKYDKKFPRAFISIRIGTDIVPTQLNITILDCTEQVTEGSCELFEKQHISNHGGPDNLLLNCCCR